MKLIKKIMEWIGGRNKWPDLSNAWAISEISDSVKFMDFVLSQATPQDEWRIQIVFTQETLTALHQFAPEGAPIPLTAKTVAALRSMLFSFNFDSDFVHHTITRNGDFLMVSYDNLSCCWISKRVSPALITRAAAERGFKFSDTGKAK